MTKLKPPRKPPTADQLRDAIDKGKTRDKVDHPDPAAAPLGTDAEAGGAPPSEKELEQARRGDKPKGAASRS